MYVQMWERPDDNTIICRVAWDNPAAKEMLQIWVPVHATLDEYTSPPGQTLCSQMHRRNSLGTSNKRRFTRPKNWRCVSQLPR